MYVCQKVPTWPSLLKIGSKPQHIFLSWINHVQGKGDVYDMQKYEDNLSSAYNVWIAAKPNTNFWVVKSVKKSSKEYILFRALFSKFIACLQICQILRWPKMATKLAQQKIIPYCGGIVKCFYFKNILRIYDEDMLSVQLY